MTPVGLFTDLDRTLVHPQHTAPADGSWINAEVWDGREITCVSRRTLSTLDALRGAGGLFVPVTTRSQAQLDRLTAVAARADAVICANGARVLIDGADDPGWRAHIKRATINCASFEQAGQRLRRSWPAGDGWLLRWRDCEQLFHYAVCRPDAIPADLEANANELLAALGWTAYLHGRKLYALPTALTKEAAVRYLADRLDVDVIVSAGDSAMDAGIVAQADIGIVPHASELHRVGVPANATVTCGEHIRAAEEITQAALDACT